MNTHPHSFRLLTALRAATLSVALFLPTPAPAEVGLAWVQPTRGVSVALDAADNVYTVDYEQALGAEMTLTKRDAQGSLFWVASYDQTDYTAWERASWVATDSAGNAIVCGTLMSGYSNPVEAASIAMKFDPNGNLLWRRVYESSFDGSSVRKCLVDANNNVYVLGMGNGPAGRVTKVKKFAPDGAALWSYFDTAGGAGYWFSLIFLQAVDFKSDRRGKLHLNSQDLPPGKTFFQNTQSHGRDLLSGKVFANKIVDDPKYI